MEHVYCRYVHNSKLSIYSVRTGEERVGEVKSAEDVKGKFSKKRKNDKNGKKGKKMKLKWRHFQSVNIKQGILFI